MEKIDFKVKYPELFHGEDKKISLITVPKLQYLTIKGSGDREENDEYKATTALMQGLAFVMKFSLKRDPPQGFFDYYMPPFSSVRRDKDKKDKKDWKRKTMLLQPAYVHKELVEQAFAIAKAKQAQEDIIMPNIELKQINEGMCLQTLHLGPYTKIYQAVKRIHTYAKKKNYTISGKEHHIHLVDRRRGGPEKFQTLIRFPIKKAK